MKKWQKALSAFIVATAMCVGVGTSVGCGDKEDHVHTYKAEWSKDKDGHWKESTCGHEDSEKEAHVDVKTNGTETLTPDDKCDVCGYDMSVPHEHTWATEWSKDANGHWHAATCEGHTNEKKDQAAHKYDNDQDTTCNDCGYVREVTPPAHEHTWATEWSKDENGHWHAATCEGHTNEKKDQAAHKYDNDQDTTCNDCGYVREVQSNPPAVTGKTYDELKASEDNVIAEDFSTTTELAEHTEWGTAGVYTKHEDDAGLLTGRYSIAGGKLTVGDGEQTTATVNGKEGVKAKVAAIVDFGEVGDWVEGYLEIAFAVKLNADERLALVNSEGNVVTIKVGETLSVVIGESTVTLASNPTLALDTAYKIYYKVDLTSGKLTLIWNDNVLLNEYAADITEVTGLKITTSNGGQRKNIVDNIAVCTPHSGTVTPPPAHEHTWATDWSKDASGHWHYATCDGHTDVKDEVVAHKDDDHNELCDVCGYDMHTHTVATEWSKDATNHWHAASCGNEAHNADKAAHKDDDHNELCDVCGYDMHTHTVATEWSKDATNHWHAASCGNEAHNADKAAHKDDDHNELCDVCGYDMHTHTIATEWSSDATNHWHAASCGNEAHNADKAAHKDENSNHECDVCGAHVHTIATDWSTSTSSHWHAADCGDPTHHANAGAHVDEDENGKCDACDYDMSNVEEHNHTIATDWSTNATQHWKAASCGDPMHNEQVGNHVNNEGDDERCDVCGYDMHTHTLAPEWSKDASGHWHAASCGNAAHNSEVIPHSDSADDDDELCDECGWNMHVHTWAADDVWSKDERGHWHAATCEGHTDLMKEEAPIAHVNEEGDDELCDVCGYDMHVHTWQDDEEWTTDEHNHWHAATCAGHTDLKKDEGEHDEEGENGACSVCGYKEEETHAPVVINASNLSTLKDGDALSEEVGIYAYGAITVENNEKSITYAGESIKITKRIKLDAKIEDKGIKVALDRKATILVYAYSGNSGTVRSLALYNEEKAIIDGTTQSVGDGNNNILGVLVFEVEANKTYYIAAVDSGINLYYIAVLDKLVEETVETHEEVAATCEAGGNPAYTLTNYGRYILTSTGKAVPYCDVKIAALGHDYTDVTPVKVKDPTAEEEGQYNVTCTRNSNHIHEIILPALDSESYGREEEGAQEGNYIYTYLDKDTNVTVTFEAIKCDPVQKATQAYTITAAGTFASGSSIVDSGVLFTMNAATALTAVKLTDTNNFTFPDGTTKKPSTTDVYSLYTTNGYDKDGSSDIITITATKKITVTIDLLCTQLNNFGNACEVTFKVGSTDVGSYTSAKRTVAQISFTIEAGATVTLSANGGTRSPNAVYIFGLNAVEK